MEAQHQNYTREVVANEEEALSKIAIKVPQGSLVLDVGCGSGMLGRFLSEHNECIVDGVDIDPEAIDLARPKYRNVFIANLEIDNLTKLFKHATYDCIVIADVAEHLVHPEQLFEDVKKLLKPNGKLLFSIPNISHISAGLELTLGRFSYQRKGLLDSTHVRFYSRQGFVEKLADCGIYVEEIDTVNRDFDDTEFDAYKHFPQHWIHDIINTREDALTYQWIMTARIFKSADARKQTLNLTKKNVRRLSFGSRLYWKSAFDSSFSEENSFAGTVGLSAAGKPVLDFDFTAANCRYPLAAVRLDLVSDATAFVFEEATLTSGTQEVLWSTQTINNKELANALAVNDKLNNMTCGTVVLPETSDPQWHPHFEDTVLKAVNPGATLRVNMNTSREKVLPFMIAVLTNNAAELAQYNTTLNNADALLQIKLIEFDKNLLSKTVEIEDLHMAIRKLQTQLEESTAKVAVVDHLQKLALQTDKSLTAKNAEIAQLHEAMHNVQTQSCETMAKAATVDQLQKLILQTNELVATQNSKLEQVEFNLRELQTQMGQTTVKAATFDHLQKLALQTEERLLTKVVKIKQLHSALQVKQQQFDDLAVRTSASADQSTRLALQTNERLLAKIADINQLHGTLQVKQQQFEDLAAQALASADQSKKLALETDEHLLVKTTEIAQLNSVLCKERMSLADAHTALDKQAHHLQDAQTQYAQTLDSLSWRLTKPLRWARRRLL